MQPSVLVGLDYRDRRKAIRRGGKQYHRGDLNVFGCSLFRRQWSLVERENISIDRTCYIWFGLGCKTVCVLLGVLSTSQLKIIVPLQVRDGLAFCAGREEKA